MRAPVGVEVDEDVVIFLQGYLFFVFLFCIPVGGVQKKLYKMILTNFN